MPFDNTVEIVAEIFKETNVDCMVAAAGSLPLERLLHIYPGLKHVIWVAEPSSRHMEWNEVPEGVGGKAEINVWHEVVEEKRNSASTEIPSSVPEAVLPKVATISVSSGHREIVEFTQAVSQVTLYVKKC